MKKSIVLILTILMIFTFTACSKDTKDNEKNEDITATEESIEDETPDDSHSGSDESDDQGQDDSTAGYDAFTKDLISTGYVSKVKDNGKGSWTITVTDKWNKMNKSDKLDFANDIYGELCAKADEQYGVLATVKMVSKSAKKVAASSKDGDGMKLY